jgi:hypothetical protein
LGFYLTLGLAHRLCWTFNLARDLVHHLRRTLNLTFGLFRHLCRTLDRSLRRDLGDSLGLNLGFGSHGGLRLTLDPGFPPPGF